MQKSKPGKREEAVVSPRWKDAGDKGSEVGRGCGDVTEGVGIRIPQGGAAQYIRLGVTV